MSALSSAIRAKESELGEALVLAARLEAELLVLRRAEAIAEGRPDPGRGNTVRALKATGQDATSAIMEILGGGPMTRAEVYSTMVGLGYDRTADHVSGILSHLQRRGLVDRCTNDKGQGAWRVAETGSKS